MSDEILVDVDGLVTAVRVHPPDEHQTIRGRALPTGVARETLGVRHAEFW